ncbi:hypothetical protein [Lewinella sp. JB7]|uniref:hypothetical protein n=1 Tax=Lewinella sp. JB7 TaxID=2962887 RepID=UPI0020C9E86D|nr:hypothetical protein [Lewinella sp. JB7]MCP9234818.1 hypothetical protein [Lewinella sp. JB7]
MYLTFTQNLFLALIIGFLATLSPTIGLGQATGKGLDKNAAEQPMYRGGVAGGDDSQVAAESAMPVDLVHFAASREPSRVIIRWRTAQETDITGFAVEYSPDGHDFREVGWRASTAARGGQGEYVYQLPTPDGTIAYYRLRIVEADGSYWYSTLRHLQFPGAPWAVAAAANPAGSDRIALRLEGLPGGEPITVRIADMTGRLLHTEVHTTVGATSELRLPLYLSPAAYVAIVERQGGDRQTLKLLVSR